MEQGVQPKRELLVDGAIGISVQTRMAAKSTKGTLGGLVLGGTGVRRMRLQRPTARGRTPGQSDLSTDLKSGETPDIWRILGR